MNEENHIIKFKHTYGLHKNLDIDDDFYIKSYTISKNRRNFIDTNVSYLNLNIYKFPSSRFSYDYIFNLSNMLYKLHTKDYYSKTYWNKLLI